MDMWSLLLLNCLFGYKWHLCLSIGTGFTSHFALSRQVAPENTNNSNNQYLLKYFSKHFMNKNPFYPWGGGTTCDLTAIIIPHLCFTDEETGSEKLICPRL